jgi:hypothetical protein
MVVRSISKLAEYLKSKIHNPQSKIYPVPAPII